MKKIREGKLYINQLENFIRIRRQRHSYRQDNPKYRRIIIDFSINSYFPIHNDQLEKVEDGRRRRAAMMKDGNWIWLQERDEKKVFLL